MKIKEVMSEAGIFKGLAKGIGQALAPNTMASNAEIPTQTGSRDFEYKGNTYRWLGQQWGVKGPGGYSPASEEVQQQLNALIAPSGKIDTITNVNLKSFDKVLPDGVSVFQREPLVIRYKTQDFLLNTKTKKWENVSGKDAPVNLQNLLPVWAEKINDLDPPKPRVITPKKVKPYPTTVTAPNGQVITYNDKDKTWIADDGKKIENASDIQALNSRLTAKRQNYQMSHG
jgi:hypothetical protein